MPYEVIVRCGREGCISEHAVPQVGACPIGWVQMKFSANGTGEVTAETFCSWRCVLTYSKPYVQAELAGRDE